MNILPMRMRNKRFKLRKILITILLLSGAYILLTAKHQHRNHKDRQDRDDERCSDEDSLAFLSELCSLHRNGKVVGPFCRHICDTEYLQFKECTHRKYGKKVFLMTCETICKKNRYVITVMKGKQLERRHGLESMLFPKDPGEDTQKYLQKVKDITQDLIFKSLIDTQAVDIGPGTDILSLMWGVNFTEFIHRNRDIDNITLLALDSVYSLVNIHEYTFMKLHTEQSLIPEIYGTCGPVYFVENTASIDGIMSKSKGVAPWSVRVKVALKMIELIKRLDTLFPSPVHICDLKASNFGLRRMSQVTIIDYDCVMLDTILKQIFKGERCESDEDCRLCDCFSECDTSTGYCTGTIYNNNIQRLCQSVFMEFRLDLRSGLLRSPPGGIKSELIRAVTQCAYPEGVTFQKRVSAATPNRVVNRLQTVLRDSLKYV